MNLMDIIGVSVTEQQRVGLLRIDGEDFSAVAKKLVKEQGYTDEHVQAGILSLKQYYAVALLDARNMHAVSDVIDPFWHTHVLFTREYTQFCQKAFGYYLHHEPLDHDDVARLDFAETLYNYTLDVYGKLFTYFDKDAHQRVTRDRIICVHFGATVQTELYDQGLFPADTRMQVA